MKTVYGIHQGCVHEGGGSWGILWEDKGMAIKEALVEYKKEKKDNDERWRKQREADPNFMMKRWRKLTGRDHWTNGIDEICIVEFEVIEE